MRALAALRRYGTHGGKPEWLVPAIWLCTATAEYIATSSTKVLADGYIARPLAIHRVDDFLRQVRSELPDISSRLVARRSDASLPEPARPRPPNSLHDSPGIAASLSVLIRVSERSSEVHRVASALLFAFDEGGSLLVGSDIGTAAMVLSEDREMIERYAGGCEAL